MRYRLEPAIWSCDTGQQILCFDRCQLIKTWMSNIKEVHGKPRPHVYQPIWSMAAMFSDSTVAVVRTRPRAIPLPMITMRKSIHGFLFPYMVMGLRLAALRAAGVLTKLARHLIPYWESIGLRFLAPADLAQRAARLRADTPSCCFYARLLNASNRWRA